MAGIFFVVVRTLMDDFYWSMQMARKITWLEKERGRGGKKIISNFFLFFFLERAKG